MAEQATQAQPQLDENQIKEAHAYLIEQVFQPVYFQKLASLGLQPANEVEADTYMRMAYQAMQVRENQALEQSRQQSTVLKSAAARLGIATPDNPATAAPPPAVDENWVKAAAAQLVRDEAVSRAVGILQTGLLAGSV